MNKIEAVIFDMDGVLLDSEPFWRQAELDIFGSIGIPLTLQDTIETMGIRIDEIVRMRCQPVDKFPPHSETERRIVDRVIELVRQKGQPLPGVRKALSCVRELGLPLALASSSCYRLIEATLDSLNLAKYFDLVYSAEGEAYGKPHPAVYLTTASQLGIAPMNCLAVEDSFSGIIAAKAAKMPVVAVPEASDFATPRFQAADVVLPSLLEFPATLKRMLAQG